MKDRLLFVDIVRIIAMTLIVLVHISSALPQPFSGLLQLSTRPTPFFYMDVGKFSVSIFVFISGCSLALSHDTFSNFKDIKQFYKRRLLRIYPIFWLGLIFSIVLTPQLTANVTNPTDFVKNIFGFQVFFQTISAATRGYNGSYWFIGVVVCLYFIYPLILSAVKKYKGKFLIMAFFIALASRMIMAYALPQIISGYMWFPTIFLFEFALGIYLVQKQLLPKVSSSKCISFLGILSFDIYLVHSPLFYYTAYHPILGHTTLIFALCLLPISLLFYRIDARIQTALSKRTDA